MILQTTAFSNNPHLATILHRTAPQSHHKRKQRKPPPPILPSNGRDRKPPAKLPPQPSQPKIVFRQPRHDQPETAASVQETHSATPERIETTLGGCFGVRDTRSRRRHTDADFPSKSRGKTHFIRVVHLTRWRAVSAISGPSHPRHTNLSVTRTKSPLAQNPAYIGPHPQS